MKCSRSIYLPLCFILVMTWCLQAQSTLGATEQAQRLQRRASGQLGLERGKRRLDSG